MIDVIAPDHVSLTTKGQPTLYWTQSFDGEGKAMQVSVLRPRKPKPLLKVILENTKKGMNGINLADHNVTLEPNVDYQWMVAYVSDKQGRWKDVLAGAMIRHVKPEGKLAQIHQRALSVDQVFSLLENGVWYDAWAGLVKLTEKNPRDASLIEIRNDLISQIELKPGLFDN